MTRRYTQCACGSRGMLADRCTMVSRYSLTKPNRASMPGQGLDFGSDPD